MSETKWTPCELMNLCMIVNPAEQTVLVQHRTKRRWSGVAFPGGHAEQGESLAQSVVREVKEETGLDISRPRLVGVVHWAHRKTGNRALIFCYRTESYAGRVTPRCPEGWHEWIPLAELYNQPLAPGLREQLAVFLDDSVSEVYYAYDDETPAESCAF